MIQAVTSLRTITAWRRLRLSDNLGVQMGGPVVLSGCVSQPVIRLSANAGVSSNCLIIYSNRYCCKIRYNLVRSHYGLYSLFCLLLVMRLLHSFDLVVVVIAYCTRVARSGRTSRNYRSEDKAKQNKEKQHKSKRR